MISVLVLTKNEAANIAECLASVAWSDDIHVLDSFSTDQTPELATAFGAKVTQRVFDNWSSHQNWALQNLPFRHPWVFYLDADERVTPDLRASLLHTVTTDSGLAEKPATSPVAFKIQRRDFLHGTWLRHVQTSAFYLRLFRPESIRYERLVNPVALVDGEIAQLSGYLDHFPFSKGITHWIARHNDYSSLEAEQIVANHQSNAPFRLRIALFGSDFHQRRYHQKELFYRLPARPLVKFLVLYLAKRGFLDGAAGLQYSVLQAIYEYLIVIKTKEIERNRSQAR